MMQVPRILIVDTCDRDRELLRTLAIQGLGHGYEIDTASTFEMAVMAVSQRDYALVILDENLGVGTSPIVSVVTLTAAGCTGRILMTGRIVHPQQIRELGRFGVHRYLEKRTLSAAHLRDSLLDATPPVLEAAV